MMLTLFLIFINVLGLVYAAKRGHPLWIVNFVIVAILFYPVALGIYRYLKGETHGREESDPM